MPSITQDQLDKMLASGEVSLTPPAQSEEKKGIFPLTPEEKPSAEGPVFSRPKPTYEIPEPKPLGRAPNKEEKKYLLETRRGLKNIKNPEYRRIASEATLSGARIEDIDGLVGYYKSLDEYDNEKHAFDKELAKELRKEDILQKRNEIRLNQKQTRDRSKLSQTIGEKWADLNDATNHLDKLMDSYHPDNVGVFDAQSPVRWTKRQFGDGEDGTIEPHENSMTGLETALKKAFGFGANYSDKEQEMMRRYMPSDTDGEESYKRQVSASARAIKRLLQAKIETQGLAGYETGNLKKMLENMDRVIEKADQFAGLSSSNNESADQSPKNLRSLSGAPVQSPAPTKVLSREDKIKMLKGEL